MFNQEREQAMFNQQQQLSQELDMSRREIANLRETINMLKNEKALLASQQQQQLSHQPQFTSFNNINSITASQPVNSIPPSRPHLSLDTFNSQSSSYENSSYTPSNTLYNTTNQAPQPSSFNRKNTNILYATTTSSNFAPNNFNSHVTSIPSYPTSTYGSNTDYSTSVVDTLSQPHTPANSSQKGFSTTSKTTSNYTTNASSKPESTILATPSSKSSQDTPFTLSMLNSKHESPKERQANRNKIMGTSYSLKPFAVDAPKNHVAAEIDDKLMQLALEKTKLEGDMQKLLSMGIKSIAAKKQKMSLESRLEEIEKETSQLKMKLRSGKF